MGLSASYIEYKDLPEDLKDQLENEIFRIGDTQKPENLYNNIIRSTGTVGTISTLFEVPFGLVMRLRELNNLV